jgi:hypothetical protein
MTKVIATIVCGALITLNAVAALPQEPIKHGGKIETKYDGFAFETVMRLRKMKVTCAGFKGNFKNGCVSIDVALHCPGTQISHVGKVTLQLIFELKDWGELHAFDQRDLSLVADTETMRLGRMRRVATGDTFVHATTTETLEASLTYDVFKKMVAAQSIEMQVGPSKIELREKNLAALRDLNSRVVK